MNAARWFILGVAVAALLSIPAVQAMSSPEVFGVVPGRDATEGVTILQVFGTKLNKFKSFSIEDSQGPTGIGVQLAVKGKTSIVLKLKVDLPGGDYDLELSPKKGDSLFVPFTQPDDSRLDLEALPRISASTTSGSAVNGSSTALLEAGVHGTFDAPTTFGFGLLGESEFDRGYAVYGLATAAVSDATGVVGESRGNVGVGVRGSAASASGSGVGVLGFSNSVDGIAVIANMSGNGGPNSVALQVDHSGTSGNIARFQQQGQTLIRFDMNGVGYFNGGTQIGGADFAESVAVNAPKREFEPGDVMVIDTEGERRFALSKVAESPLVAGIYSTKPGVLARPGQVVENARWSAEEVPLAITGIVPCKVCDEGGKIRAGDLLVTASIPGYARKAPADPKAGTLVGKALGKLDGKRGKVEVLITMR